MPRIPVMVLGERRIAQQALTLLNQTPFCDAFNIRVMSTNEAFYSGYRRTFAGSEPHFIGNDARRTDEIVAALKSYKIGLILSIQHVWVLPDAVLDAVEGRAFNLHNARLPDYRGHNAISHALLNGEKTFTSTLHWMAPKVDTGDIAYAIDTPVREDDTAVSLYVRTIDAAERAFRSLLEDLADGRTPPRVPIDPGAGRYYRRADLDPYRELNGITDAEDIRRRARALYFPPHSPAVFRTPAGSAFVVPAGSWIPSGPGANHHTW